MDAFLKSLDQEIEAEKSRQSVLLPDENAVNAKWQGKSISKEDKAKFSKIFENADVKKEGKIRRKSSLCL